MQIVSITDGRKKLGELVTIVKYRKQAILLGKHGKAEAILMAIPESEDNTPTDALNAASPSFRFLEAEPDLYSRKDLR